MEGLFVPWAAADGPWDIRRVKTEEFVVRRQITMKDAIDKRNEREKIARSIVKRRNIVYISKEELERRQQEESRQQDRETAEELARRLRDDEDKKKAMEIERLLAEQKMLEKQLATGMDATGKHPMDDITQERVEAILSEKSKQLQDIISASSIALAQKSEPVEIPVPEENQGNDAGAETDNAESDSSVPEGASGETAPDGEMGQKEAVPLEEEIQELPAEEYQEEIPAGEQEDMGTAIPGPEEMQEPPESGFDEGPGQTDESEAEA